MKLLVDSDVFDISIRLKNIDKDYAIYFDTTTQNYLLYAHNIYSLNLGKILDARVIDKVRYTRVENAEKIFTQLELDNINATKQQENKIKDSYSYQIQDICEYTFASSKYLDGNIYQTKWI